MRFLNIGHGEGFYGLQRAWGGKTKMIELTRGGLLYAVVALIEGTLSRLSFSGPTGLKSRVQRVQRKEAVEWTIRLARDPPPCRLSVRVDEVRSGLILNLIRVGHTRQAAART